MIAFAGVSKRYDQSWVLRDMTLDMANEGITCLLGISGCGKSTAMRIAAGLIEPDSGEVFIPPMQCGVVFQDTRLLPWLTTAENLILGVPAALRQSEGQKRCKEALESVSLEPTALLPLFPHELSGGMAQRVGIARALLRKPQFLLLDEPFAALDAITRGELQRMLKSLVSRRRNICLFVTHDIEEAFAIGARIIIMKDGRAWEAYEGAEFGDWQKRESVRAQILGLLGSDQEQS